MTPIKSGTASRLGIRRPPSASLRLMQQMLNACADRDRWVWTRDQFGRPALVARGEAR